MNRVIQETRLDSRTTLQLVKGDLTTEVVDAIVNPANAQLAHGGGVAGLISRKGGPAIQEQSRAWVREHGPVSHTSPAVTSGGDMPARYVIHAVGPIWGSGDEDRKLAAAVSGALGLANQLELRSLSLPAISTGIFGFPLPRAARIILNTIITTLVEFPQTSLVLVRVVLYDQLAAQAFLQAWQELGLQKVGLTS